jgi:hypothetical protein
MSALVSTYTSLITSEHADKPKFMAMIAACAQPSVDQQNQFRTFPTIFDIDYAVGSQLDALGAWIGANRNVSKIIAGYTILPDPAFRTLLKLTIAENFWDGTVPGAYTIFNSIFTPEGVTVSIQDNQDMTMNVTFVNLPSDPVIQGVLLNYFNLRPAGVGTNFYANPLILQDSSGQLWLVTITDQAITSITPVTFGTPVAPIIQDLDGTTNLWKVVVDISVPTSPRLSVVSQGTGAGSQTYALLTLSFNPAHFSVSVGRLEGNVP